MKVALRRSVALVALAVGMTSAGLALTAAPASATGVYVCWTYVPFSNSNPVTGTTTTSYPFFDGVQTSRCDAQGAGTDLPL